MTKRVLNIAGVIITLFVPVVYFYGAWQWKKYQFSEIPEVVDSVTHLFCVTFSSAFYMLSFALYMVANSTAMKAASSIVSSFCAVVLYQECVYGNDQWSEWSYWLIVVVAANYFILFCVIEKIKRIIKNGNKSNNNN